MIEETTVNMVVAAYVVIPFLVGVVIATKRGQLKYWFSNFIQ